jgi:L-asparaginase
VGERRHVAVLSLGGTIAMTRAADATGVAPALGAAELLAAIPTLADLDVEIEVRDVLRIPGASLTIPDIARMSAAVREMVQAGADGVVITQGTDTIEETAFLLDLLYDGGAPVVVTGAMRNPTMPGPDGPANLTAAITAAADPTLQGAGCLVVMQDEVHAAARVRKSHTTSPGAFASPGAGPLGVVREGRVHLRSAARAYPRTLLPTPDPDTAMARVLVHTATLGDDGAILDILAERCDGLVVAGFGAGHVPASWLEHLMALVDAIPIVLTSRIGNGSVLDGTYAFPGSETSLYELGVIGGGTLTAFQARLALTLLLTAGADRDTIVQSIGRLGQAA